jgi:hypothetical protein
MALEQKINKAIDMLVSQGKVVRVFFNGKPGVRLLNMAGAFKCLN